MVLGTLDLIGRRATWFLAGGVFLGLAWQPLAQALAPWLEALIVMNLSLSMMRIEPARLLVHLRRPWLAAAAFLFSMIVAPLLLWALVEAAGAPGALGAGIVFHALTTPIMSAPALCILFGLDAALALIVTVASYALVPLTLPPLALLLLGIELDVTVIELMWRLGRIVAASFVIAAAARSLAATRRMVEAHASRIDGILVIGMVGVAVSLMSGLPGYAAANPAHTSITTAATFLTNIALQVAAAAAFWRMGRKTAVTVALVTGNTNVALVFAAVSESASYDLLVYFVLGQFPIYVLPLVAVPVYRRVIAGGRAARAAPDSRP